MINSLNDTKCISDPNLPKRRHKLLILYMHFLFTDPSRILDFFFFCTSLPQTVQQLSVKLHSLYNVSDLSDNTVVPKPFCIFTLMLTLISIFIHKNSLNRTFLLDQSRCQFCTVFYDLVKANSHVITRCHLCFT